MPFEIFIIVILTIVMGAAVVTRIIKSITQLMISRNSSATGQSGLAASELKKLITEAVEDAVEPLEAKIDLLEKALQQPSRTLPELDLKQLDFGMDEETPEAAPVETRTIGRSVNRT